MIGSYFDKSLDKRWQWSAGAIAVLLAILMTSIHGARAQDAPVVGQIGAKQATPIDLPSATARPSVPMPPGLNFNRPTPGAGVARGGPPLASRPAAKAAPSGPGSALSLFFQSASVNENTGGGFPPDGDIATGLNFTVQINNFVVTMYNVNTRTLAKQVNLATFFGDGRFLFDPRIIYDPVWQRFVVLADGCNPCSGSGTASFFDLAISKTSDPTGGYFIYSFGVGTGAGDFADFEQMGMDLNSIIFTYNDFLLNGSFDARTFAIAKAYLYNGFGFSVPLFGGSGCTVAPPYVLDNGGPSYTLVACPGDNKVFLGPMFNSGLSNVSVTHWQATVPTAAFGVPPCAPQPGVVYCLETGDSRFENRSAQIGNRIWNVNTTRFGTATPRWYEFNTSNNTLVASNIWFATGTSTDWHPSIVVNGVGATGSSPTGETFGTWMSVDATHNLNLQLRAIGGSFDNAGAGAGIAVGPASAQPLTNQTLNGRNRSGDYSYISLYPGPAFGCAANEFALLEGEVSLGTIWNTRVGFVKHC
jgi:hypothetical protein